MAAPAVQDVQGLLDDLGLSTSLSDAELEAALRGAGPLSSDESSLDSSFSDAPLPVAASPPRTDFARLRLAREPAPASSDVPVLAAMKNEVYRLRQQLAQQGDDLTRARDDASRDANQEVARLSAELAAKTKAHAEAAGSVEQHKSSLADLELSAAQYRELAARDPATLTLREHVLCRVHARDLTARQKLEASEREKDALLEQLQVVQTKLGRESRQAQQATSTLSALQQDMEMSLAAERARAAVLAQDLAAKTKLLQEYTEAGAGHEGLLRDHRRVVRELSEAQQTLSNQAVALKQITDARGELTQKVAEAESVAALQRQDVEHLKREGVHAKHQQDRLQYQVEQLETALAAAKEKKRALVESLGTDQERATRALEQRVEEEIAKVGRRANDDQETMKAHLREVFEREARMLQDRAAQLEKQRLAAEAKLSGAEDELTRLQVAHREMQSAYERDRTEQRASCRLAEMEAERLRLAVEQAALRERELLGEKQLLGDKVELLRTECRDLERKCTDDHLQDRAELLALRKRLETYEEMEADLDQAIHRVADSGLPSGGDQDATAALGAVLAATPTASSRRLQESLTLARTLYKRQRELTAAEERIVSLERRLEEAESSAAAESTARAATSQPQQYLVDSIRDKEKEVQFLLRRAEGLERELQSVRRELLREGAVREEAERDLAGVLARRERLHSLQTLVLQAEERQGAQPAQPLQRPRAPGSAVPVWFEKLQAKKRVKG